MSRPLVEFPDVELVVADWLNDVLDFDVGVPVPARYQPALHGTFLRIRGDGAPTQVRGLTSSESVALVAYAVDSPTAKAAALRAQAYACAGPWPSEIANVDTLTGVLATRDQATNAELASVTIRVVTRAVPVT